MLFDVVFCFRNSFPTGTLLPCSVLILSMAKNQSDLENLVKNCLKYHCSHTDKFGGDFRTSYGARNKFEYAVKHTSNRNSMSLTGIEWDSQEYPVRAL